MRISDWSSDVCSSDRPTTPRLQRATTTMPGRGQAPIAAAPIRPGPRARHPRKRQPKYPNADCPRRPHLNAQEPSLSGDSPAPAAPPPRPRASTSLVVLATLAIGDTLWAAQAVLLPIALAMFFALIGNPILRGLRQLWFPRFHGALLDRTSVV